MCINRLFIVLSIPSNTCPTWRVKCWRSLPRSCWFNPCCESCSRRARSDEMNWLQHWINWSDRNARLAPEETTLRKIRSCSSWPTGWQTNTCTNKQTNNQIYTHVHTLHVNEDWIQQTNRQTDRQTDWLTISIWSKYLQQYQPRNKKIMIIIIF